MLRSSLNISLAFLRELTTNNIEHISQDALNSLNCGDCVIKETILKMFGERNK